MFIAPKDWALQAVHASAGLQSAGHSVWNAAMTETIKPGATETKPTRKPRSAIQSLRDIAYETIKRQIITCELRPGEVLSEAVLSDTLQIGRTPVRQAIDRLVTSGLVDVMPRKGLMVKPITFDEIFDIIEARLINESHCARRAALQADDNEIARLTANVSAMWKATEGADIDTMMDLDREFHSIISRAARNHVITEILANLHDHSTRLWFISLRAIEQHVRVGEQHAAIVEGIRKRDPDAAEAAIRAHIESFRDNLARQI